MKDWWMRKVARKISLGLINAEGEGGGQANNGEGGGGEPKYYESFPAEVQSWDEVKNSATPEAFWGQITNHRQHLGQSIRIPGPDAGEDAVKAFNEKLQSKVPGLMRTPNFEDEASRNDFYAKMGRPEDPKEYKIPEIKDAEGKVIEGVDNTFADSHFRKIAHENGLSQSQFAKVVEGITKLRLGNHESEMAKLKAEQTAISDEWGAAEAQNYTILKNFAKKTDAPPGILAALENKTLDSASAMWMLKAANASFGSKDRGIDDQNSGMEGVMAPAEAGDRLNEIMNNKKHPYWNKMDPGHAAAVSRVRELHILKAPKTAKQPAPGTTFNIGGDQANVG